VEGEISQGQAEGTKEEIGSCRLRTEKKKGGENLLAEEPSCKGGGNTRNIHVAEGMGDLEKNPDEIVWSVQEKNNLPSRLNYPAHDRWGGIKRRDGRWRFCYLGSKCRQ